MTLAHPSLCQNPDGCRFEVTRYNLPMSDPKFPEFNRLTDTPHGQMLYNRNDTYIGRSIELYGEWSGGECRVFDAIVKPGMTVIEVGSNIGAHTVPLARSAGPQGVVYAFEPQRITFQTLCANLALNHLTNVVPYHAAAGDKPGSLLVPELKQDATNNFGGLGLGDHQAGFKVPVMTIDSLNPAACHFIKADVEGMEESALRGAEQTIRKFLPVVYVENDRPEKSESLVKYLVSLGYRLFIHNPQLFDPNNYKGNKENVFPNIASKNLLCVHQSKPANITGFPELKLPDDAEVTV